MGWGVTKVHRTAAVGECTVSVEKKKCDATVIDMCSETRRVGSGQYLQTADSIAARICKSLWGKTECVVVFLFDNNKYLHPERKRFYKTRYPAPTQAQKDMALVQGKVVVNDIICCPDRIPYSKEQIAALLATTPVNFNRLFCTRQGKAKVWELISASIINWHCRNGNPALHQMILWYDQDVPSVWPRNSNELRTLAGSLSQNTFGEADQRVAEAVQVLSNLPSYKTVLVQTIDTDMLLQTMCLPSLSDSTVVFVQLKNEAINVTALRAQYGDTQSERLSAAFWLMACGGVDYCKGLTQFGFSTQALIDVALSARGRQCAVARRKGTLIINTSAIIGTLATLKRRKKKGKTVGTFADEIRAMAFSLALFAGEQSTRLPYGGPDVPQIAIIDYPKTEEIGEHTFAAMAEAAISKRALALSAL